MKKNIWRITQSQIQSGDIDGAIINVDPEQIPDLEIPGLHGAVRLRIQDAQGSADIFMDPKARQFFRAMHARWPWVGYFLRLKVITLASPDEQIKDLSIFMALALCHCSDLTYCESPYGIVLKYNITHLSKHLAEIQGRAAELAATAGVPDDEIRKRDNLISDAVASFFECGKNLQPKNQKRKNR